ncbi:response regulator transcription factor [Actinosynnema pretiosum subsp. pretiosum]|uniref:Two component transcriptional regulator, LuxR family n=2 Tax=Actinosynnema TaxID=40566 RepID=C6WES7_ACTMD|nr:response regulator [Actinosynnema mirum]ACU39702.1 two component transcriptional regulator, LuxR family [Actinosynnema mirum DSM 43827]AXX33212.1 DNA-binding response regulator, LuxR family [Actinosynnema pretiosum subsp. pretiosum]QUF02955.1 response regulator transcription factor [Actinosynnema pretiosum subsp. pretiosum]
MIRVLIADDEPLMRAGIKAILGTAEDIELVDEVGDGREAVRVATERRVDVAVLDIRMPRLDGLAAARELKAVAPSTRVVVLTTFGEDDNIVRALSEGAAGFLLKDSAPEELLRAVRAVHAGEAYLSPMVTSRVVGMVAQVGQPRRQEAMRQVQRLTDREVEVLELLGLGMSNADVGQRLHMSEATVKTYVSRLLAKLGLTNRVQAALLARDAGLSAEG